MAQLLPAVTMAGPEDSALSSFNAQGFGAVRAGQPPVSTPPTLRPVVVAPADDIFTPNPPFTFQGGGKPSIAVTPLTLRQLVFASADDFFTPNPPSVSLYGGKPSAGVTPPSLRPIIAVLAEDPTSLAKTGDAVLAGGKPSVGVTPSSLRPTLAPRPDESFFAQAEGYGAARPGPVFKLPPGLRQTTVVPQEDVSAFNMPAGQQLGGWPNAKTFPSPPIRVYPAAGFDGLPVEMANGQAQVIQTQLRPKQAFFAPPPVMGTPPDMLDPTVLAHNRNPVFPVVPVAVYPLPLPPRILAPNIYLPTQTIKGIVA